MLSKGARRVTGLAKKYGYAAMAKALGCNEGAVRRHVSGMRMPNAALRGRYAKVYDVPLAEWVEPSKPAKAVPKEAPEPEADEPADSAPKTTRESLEALVIDAGKMLRDAQRDKNASHRDRSGLVNALKSCLVQLARVRGELDVTEQMIVRSPAWARAMATVLEAVRPHPDAARDIAKALEAFEAVEVQS